MPATPVAGWNRESGHVWIDGVTIATAVTRKVDAYAAVARAGYMRRTDWRLVASGSPLREMPVESI